MKKSVLEIVKKSVLEIIEKLRKIKVPSERQYVLGFAFVVALLALGRFLSQNEASAEEVLQLKRCR